jgi:hypothetical protein
MGGDEGLVYASVSWELGSSFITSLHPAAPFGRGQDNVVRFGHQPVLDAGVPRRAGQLLLVGDGRIAVENLSDRLAFDIVYEGAPLEAVRPGVLYSPPSDHFEICVSGSTQSYSVRVHALRSPVRLRMRSVGGDDGPITRLDPELTMRQWEILDAYTAPLRAGRPVAATHAQVAEELSWSMSLIRLESSEIWNEFVIAGIPMRDFPDKRDAIVDAAVRHRLLPPEHHDDILS